MMESFTNTPSWRLIWQPWGTYMAIMQYLSGNWPFIFLDIEERTWNFSKLNLKMKNQTNIYVSKSANIKKYWNCDFFPEFPPPPAKFIYGNRHLEQSFFSVLAQLTHSRTSSAWAWSHNPQVAISPICHLGKRYVINLRTVCESLSWFGLITGL